eukprot:1187407-Prorocentrum_minimum.AAC.2
MAFGAELCVEQTSSRGVFTSEGVTWTGLCIFMAFASMFAIMATLLLQSISRRNAISDRKMTELSALIRSSATRMATMAARNGESTEWLNLLLQNAWHGGLFANLENKLRHTLETRLAYMIDARDDEDTARKVPAWVREFRVDNFSMGTLYARITSPSRTPMSSNNSYTVTHNLSPCVSWSRVHAHHAPSNLA